jgi:hypothetical protein
MSARGPGFGDSREMGCSRADLERWLREVTGLAAFESGDDWIRVPVADFHIEVRFTPAPPRRLGLVTFRALRVRFKYPPGRAEQAREWIGRFDFHTQRGGG